MNHEGARKSTANREHLHDIKVRPIKRGERHQWDELIRHYHYLGLHSLIGESIRYIAVYQKQWLALIGWSAAVLKCKVRDQWIGWPSFFQYQRLSFIANNSRFLILPRLVCPRPESQAIIPGLASHLQLPDLSCRDLCRSAVTQNTPQETKPMRLSLKDAESLKERLSQIPDPRMPRGKRHRKLSVMTISLCALLCSATSFAAIAAWAKSCSQNMLKRLGCRFNPKTRIYEPPSEPTIRRFLQDVDAEAVDAALYGWLQSLSRRTMRPRLWPLSEIASSAFFAPSAKLLSHKLLEI